MIPAANTAADNKEPGFLTKAPLLKNLTFLEPGALGISLEIDTEFVDCVGLKANTADVYTKLAVNSLISNIQLTPGPTGANGIKGDTGLTGATGAKGYQRRHGTDRSNRLTRQQRRHRLNRSTGQQGRHRNNRRNKGRQGRHRNNRSTGQQGRHRINRNKGRQRRHRINRGNGWFRLVRNQWSQWITGITKPSRSTRTRGGIGRGR